MSFFAFLKIVVLICHCIVLFLSERRVKPLIGLLLVSSIYYGLLGYYYWAGYEEGVFLGVYWGDYVDVASLIVVVSSLLFSVSIFLVSRVVSLDCFQSVGEGVIDGRCFSKPFWVFFIIGVLSSLYVLRYVVSGGSGLNSSDSLVLIAYQFSDLLIPVLLYSVARQGFSRLNILFILSFVFYASVVGFRYKLALIFLPLIVFFVFPVDGGTRISKIKAVVLFSLMLCLFSVLTLARQKFGGIDLSKISNPDLDSVLYGFFAESNVLFGLIGVYIFSIEDGGFIYFQPLIDAVLELIPRFLMPNRITGEYLSIPLQLLGSDQALNSGTAYPYVGELILMAGWCGFFFGNIILGFICFYLVRFVVYHSVHGSPVRDIGVGLVSAFFGFYFFSRGYLPQMFKGFVFVVLPYLYLLRNSLCARVARIS